MVYIRVFHGGSRPCGMFWAKIGGIPTVCRINSKSKFRAGRHGHEHAHRPRFFDMADSQFKIKVCVLRALITKYSALNNQDRTAPMTMVL